MAGSPGLVVCIRMYWLIMYIGCGNCGGTYNAPACINYCDEDRSVFLDVKQYCNTQTSVIILLFIQPAKNVPRLADVILYAEFRVLYSADHNPCLGVQMMLNE